MSVCRGLARADRRGEGRHAPAAARRSGGGPRRPDLQGRTSELRSFFFAERITSNLIRETRRKYQVQKNLLRANVLRVEFIFQLTFLQVCHRRLRSRFAIRFSSSTAWTAVGLVQRWKWTSYLTVPRQRATRLWCARRRISRACAM